VAVAAEPTFFQGLSEDDLERLLGSLTRRHFPVGARVLTEGDRPTEMYVITSGVCGVFVRDRTGGDTQIGQIGPGATIGEMALFAGQAEMVNVAPATVRALTALDVVALDAPGFYALAAEFPQVLHNIGAILSQRLTRSYQHALQAEHGRVTVLADCGGPRLLAYALACSVAWHSRGSTVLVVVGPAGTAGLEALARRDGGGARLQLIPPTGEFAEAALAGTVEELSHHYEHVLLLVEGRGEDQRLSPGGLDVRRVRLADATSSLPADPVARPGHTVRGWASRVPRPWPDMAGVLHVPPLESADEQALREGLLPPSTAAGKALGWMARDLCGLKVGLALGAGSVRGYAHYGVLRVFERIGLQFDYVTGTSIGGIIASTYALGHTSDEAAHTMEETSVRAFRLTVPVHSLLSNAGVAANFRQVGGDKRIEDLEVPLALVAADLTTGREVVLRRGLLRIAALASMAIPGIYPPVRMGRHVLVDGGIVNPVPISVAVSMGADVVVAVSLGRSATQPLPDLEAVAEKGRLPSLVQTITRSVEIMQGRIGAQATAAATVLIEPSFASTPSVGLQSFHQGRPYIRPGEAAAEAALPHIAASLPWLRN
jgi:NTE family protein